MRAIDTNVLVRLIVRDEERQAHAAEGFIQGGAWVSHLVLAETVWVLDAVYERSPAQIASAVEQLLDQQAVSIEGADVVEAALAQFRRRPALGFSDCLMLEVARKAGHLPMGTFDRDLARLDGAQRLS
jgi:predicted nucleic-acid-binding protein